MVDNRNCQIYVKLPGRGINRFRNPVSWSCSEKALDLWAKLFEEMVDRLIHLFVTSVDDGRFQSWSYLRDCQKSRGSA